MSNTRVKIKSNSDRISVVHRKKSSVLVDQSGQIPRSIDSLSDVDASNAVDGSVLIYKQSEEKFLASRTLEKQIVNGGNF